MKQRKAGERACATGAQEGKQDAEWNMDGEEREYHTQTARCMLPVLTIVWSAPACSTQRRVSSEKKPHLMRSAAQTSMHAHPESIGIPAVGTFVELG